MAAEARGSAIAEMAIAGHFRASMRQDEEQRGAKEPAVCECTGVRALLARMCAVCAQEISRYHRHAEDQ